MTTTTDALSVLKGMYAAEAEYFAMERFFVAMSDTWAVFDMVDTRAS
ncbi:hypothetical protein [Amycolatopsis sp. NPDC049868]